MLDNEKVRYLTIFAVVTLLLYIPFNIFIEVFNISYGPRLTDFDTYYHSAHRLRNGGSIYADTVAPDGSSRRFVYPPVAILIFLPFSFFPFTIAGILWNVFSVLVFSIGMVKLLKELLYNSNMEFSKTHYIIAISSAIAFSPMVNWIKAGQASGIVAGGLCLSVAYLLENERTSNVLPAFYASVLIPVICSIKPYYAPSGGHLLQDIKRLAYGIFGGAIIFTLSLLLLGVDTHIKYINVIQSGQSNLVFTTPPSQWNAGIYAPLHIFGELAISIRIILILATIATILVLTYYDYEQLEIALIGIAIIPIATPTRVDGLVALIPVYIVILIHYWENRLLRASTFISILLVHIHPYTIELLSKIGPHYIPAFDTISPIIPLLQPALWGHLLLIALVIYIITIVNR